MNKKILLVEGEADRSFFEAICRTIKLDYQVKVSTPRDINKEVGDGKGNAINMLGNLIEQLTDGQLERIAIIVDADYDASHGLGFKKTLRKIIDVLRDNDYNVDGLSFTKKPNNGFIFRHNDGLPDIGVWIMPSNSDDGYIEDFIKCNITTTSSKLFKDAATTVEKIKNPLFRIEHKAKAEVATWMAWQKIPGQPLSGMIGGRLIDFTSGEGKTLIEWLKIIFT